jgi:hypothetical protein
MITNTDAKSQYLFVGPLETTQHIEDDSLIAKESEQGARSLPGDATNSGINDTGVSSAWFEEL